MFEKTTSVEQNTTEVVSSVPETNLTIDYKKAKEKLNSFGYSTFLQLVDFVEKNTNGDLKKEANKVLEDILQTNDIVKMSDLALKLQGIVSKYKKEKEEAQGESEEARESVSNGLIDKIGNFLFDPISLKEIKDLQIDGKVENFDEFEEKLDSLIEIINKDNKLDEKNKKKLIKGLRKIAETVKSKQKYTLDFLDNKINDLGEQIKSQPDGKIVIDIEGVKVYFNSKKEAYNYVRFLKKNAEDEFQSFYADIGDFLGYVIGGIFSSDLPLKPYEWVINSAKDGFRNYEDNDSVGWLIVDGLQVLVLSIMAINYTETIYRRIIKDTAGKMGLEWGKIGNFDTQRLSYQTGEGDQERQAKYNRRLDAYNFLKNFVSEIKPEYKEEYLKELESIRNYINIDSKTFWLKFEALKNERGILGRGINAFKYGPKFTPFDIERQMSDFINAEINSDVESAKENLSYVFDDVTITKDEKGRLNIEKVGEETEEIKKFRNYINSIADSERRTRTMNALDKYLSYLKNHAIKKEIIKTTLYNIIENNYYDKELILAEIDKKYFPDKEEIDKIERSGWFKWFGEAWDGTKESFDKLKEFSIEKWGKYAPTSLTYGKALAIKFRNEVEKGNFEGNENDLKEVFRKIDSGKLAFNTELPGFNKLKFPIKLLTSIFGRYGLKLPSIVELRKFGDKLKMKRFTEILNDGGTFQKEVKEAKKYLKGETSEGAEISENLKHIFDLDTLNFPSEKDSLYGKDGKEGYFEKMYEELIEKSEQEDFRMLQDDVKLEIIKLKNGYLSNDKILEILSSSFTKEEMKADNIKDFIKKVETNRMIVTLEDMKNSILPELKSGNSIDERIVHFDIESELEEINKKGTKLGESHFKKGKFGIFNNGEKLDIEDVKFKNILELAKFLHPEDDYKGKSELGKLFDKINGGTSYTGKEFFEELEKALDITISIDEDIDMEKFENQLKEQVKIKAVAELDRIIENYESKSNEEKKKIIEKLKSALYISDGKTPTRIHEILTTIEKSKGETILKKYTDLIDNFKEKEKDVEEKEQEKREKIKEINEKINYLKILEVPKNQNSLEELNKKLVRDYGFSLEYFTNKRGIFKNKESINKQKIQDKILELKLERLKLLNPEQLKLYFGQSSFEEILKEYNIKIEELSNSKEKNLRKIVEFIQKGHELSEKARDRFIEKIETLRKIK